MSPQLSAAQLQHAINNGEKLLKAKRLEIAAYESLCNDAPEATRELFREMYGHESPLTVRLANAAKDILTAKIEFAKVELEEREMQLKAIKEMQRQANSRIQVPSFGKQT